MNMLHTLVQRLKTLAPTLPRIAGLKPPRRKAPQAIQLEFHWR